MSQRISHSLLDPVLTLPMKRWYPWLPLPRQLPPEAIVLTGHGLAIVAAVGFAFSTEYWWGGLLIAFGVVGNHIADVFDGTHARATGQCRNGGELLDHFFDPLSFAYWLTGLAVSCRQLEMGIAAVICLFATAVLTNIKAKMIGQFTLNSFGPTEFKSLLVLYGGAMAWLATGNMPVGWLTAPRVATGFLAILLVVGIVQLVLGLLLSVREVNREGSPPDTTEWVTTRDDGNDV